jgi:hypothetical protein
MSALLVSKATYGNGNKYGYMRCSLKPLIDRFILPTKSPAPIKTFHPCFGRRRANSSRKLGGDCEDIY